MSDNHSGKNGQRDPWGRSPQEGPPDLADIFKKLFGGKSGSKSPKGSGSSRYVWFAVALFFVVWVISGIYVVSPAEEAVILRFGKFVTTQGPGPHWIPQLIYSRDVLNVQQVDTFAYQAEMLTQDENIVSVSLAVQYRIGQPKDYLFNVVDPVQTVKQATSSALRQVVGQMSLDAVLTTGRQQLRDEVAKILNETLSLYKAGIEVTDVALQPAKPPEAVTDAFDDAIKAREDEQRFINKAEAYARQKISLAKGQVARVQQSAEAYQQKVVLRAEGETARYLSLLVPYTEAPQVTRDRLYIDTVQKVLSHTSNILVDGSGNNILYLPLNQFLNKQAAGDEDTRSAGAKDKPVSNVTTLPDLSSDDDVPPGVAGSIYDRVTRPTYPQEETAR